MRGLRGLIIDDRYERNEKDEMIRGMRRVRRMGGMLGLRCE